jgi:Lar family restriction alleviation protein
MKDKNLKPCPFCGGEARMMYAPNNDFIGIPCYGVECEKCNIMIGTVAEGQTDFFRTPKAAAKAWNARKRRLV